ncbi:MAG: ArsR/SmtB family transcription factor [Thermoplasmataceae archaeon]
MDDDIDYILSALENNTRRAILRRLVIDESYALEISKKIGLSQQAINKQLEVLERANLIFSIEKEQNSQGAARKIYRPTGFSTMIIDYSRSFVETRRYSLGIQVQSNTKVDGNNTSLIDSLKDINRRLEDLMNARSSLIRQKDAIISTLTRKIQETMLDKTTSEIILNYIELLDEKTVALKMSLPEYFIRETVSLFLDL